MGCGPAILVGHSWGGTVITQAGAHPKVAGLVYVSALAPDAGETTAQQYDGFAPTPEFVIDVGEDGYGYINREAFHAGFAADVSDADAAYMADSQVPIDMAVFGTAVSVAAWHDKPSWAVIATEDQAFDQAMLQHMATRIGADITNVNRTGFVGGSGVSEWCVLGSTGCGFLGFWCCLSTGGRDGTTGLSGRVQAPGAGSAGFGA